MNAPALISIAQWGMIATSFEKGGLPMPFVQEIFLMECTIAGTTHIKTIEQHTATLDTGSLLGFLREPANTHDPLAILIFNSQNQKLGYVPRSRNEVIARLMDAGKLIFGKVESIAHDGSWVRIGVKVFLRDDFATHITQK